MVWLHWVITRNFWSASRLHSQLKLGIARRTNSYMPFKTRFEILYSPQVSETKHRFQVRSIYHCDETVVCCTWHVSKRKQTQCVYCAVRTGTLTVIIYWRGSGGAQHRQRSREFGPVLRVNPTKNTQMGTSYQLSTVRSSVFLKSVTSQKYLLSRFALGI